MTCTEAPIALPTPRGREDQEAEEAQHPPRQPGEQFNREIQMSIDITIEFSIENFGAG